MILGQLTDDDYRLVAGVAERERWADLERPPLEGGGPRTLTEVEALVRYAQALEARTPVRRGVDRRTAMRVMWVAGALGLGVCWMVSPGRTIAGLLLVGVFCGLGLLRRGRRGAATGRRGRVAGRRGARPLRVL